jgi:hypothetical protein
MIRKLLHDERGNAAVNLLSHATTWPVVFGVFLLNMQLARTYEQRDAVDHSVAIGADTAMKTYCETLDHKTSAPAVQRSIEAALDQVGGHDHCQISVTEVQTNGLRTESAARELEVEVACKFPCKIPFAAQVLCTRGVVTLKGAAQAVAMGCDGK